FYTWADAEDDYVDWLTEFQLQDPLNLEDERGPSLHVPEHKATLSAIYTTTVGQYPWWARDWTLAVIADYAAGRPFNVLAGTDRNRNGDPLSDRPVGVGRNSGELPDYFIVDARVARRIPIGPVGLEAIFEVFNLFNRENVLEVNNVIISPDFERATRVGDPRRIQLGARLTF
ncbi:MAG: TonB-dependent receptor, partial [Acidobacteriota bacterium]|nr:TonB-dependent receptor [Acidobacteriota bacterium]